MHMSQKQGPMLWTSNSDSEYLVFSSFTEYFKAAFFDREAAKQMFNYLALSHGLGLSTS